MMHHIRTHTHKAILAKWYCGLFFCSLFFCSVLPASFRLRCRSHAVCSVHSFCFQPFRTNNKQMDDQLFAVPLWTFISRTNSNQVNTKYIDLSSYSLGNRLQNIQHNFPLKTENSIQKEIRFFFALCEDGPRCDEWWWFEWVRVQNNHTIKFIQCKPRCCMFNAFTF